MSHSPSEARGAAPEPGAICKTCGQQFPLYGNHHCPGLQPAQQPPVALKPSEAASIERAFAKSPRRVADPPPRDDTDLLRRIAINGILPGELQAELEARLGQTKPGVTP